MEKLEKFIPVVTYLIAMIGAFFALKQWAKDSEARQDRREKAEDERLKTLLDSIEKLDEDLAALVGRTIKNEERIGGVSALHEERHSVLSVMVDELKGDVKRHNRELNMLAIWRSRIEERTKMKEEREMEERER